MQLLKIRTIPFKYDINIQNARLKVPEIEPAKMNIDTTPAEVDTKTENIKIRMDSSDMRQSMGFKTVAERAREAPAQTQQTAREVTAEFTKMGNSLGENGMSVADYVKQKILSDAVVQTSIEAIPSEQIDVSWEPASVKTTVKKSSANIDWKKSSQEMEFIPSSITVEVKQLADVEIEYLGGFNYVPPSSAPDYEEK